MRGGNLLLRDIFRGCLLGTLTFCFAVPALAAASVAQTSELRGEIADPCLGFHWRLVIDPAHPGWPGRLVLKMPNEAAPKQSSGIAVTRAKIPPAIRVGDEVTVDQSSPILHAQFQAIALQPAAVGEELKVRLLAGRNKPLSAQGAVITVLAEGIKQARWLTTEGMAR